MGFSVNTRMDRAQDDNLGYTPYQKVCKEERSDRCTLFIRAFSQTLPR